MLKVKAILKFKIFSHPYARLIGGHVIELNWNNTSMLSTRLWIIIWQLLFYECPMDWITHKYSETKPQNTLWKVQKLYQAMTALQIFLQKKKTLQSMEVVTH
jgi:hypothetical protein